MVYKVIGIMSGSSLDGLDLVFTEITENGGAWGFEIVAAACYAYDAEWQARLQNATALDALGISCCIRNMGIILAGR